MKNLFLSALLFAGTAALAAAAPNTPAIDKTTPAAVAAAKKDGWQLIWSEEFNAADPRPNPAKWTYEVGNSIRNNEAQFYTNDRRENVRVEKGVLVIEARKEKYDKAQFTSGSVTTAGGRLSMRYGRMEIRAKIPNGRGVWPALWMLGTNIGSTRTEDGTRIPGVGWPRCGEIDIMEYVGHIPGTVHATMHTGNKEAANPKKTHFSRGGSIKKETPWDGFHLYILEWSPEQIEVFYDTKKILTYRRDLSRPDHWPFDKPHYLIMNIAIGGSWGGAKGIDDAAFPCRMEVDYVRVWKK
ncbi:MAG: glycoside hydrolase family 16 protein [Puniceicoccales bacterium]|nr:glycoside hydrolase family 16 protein [Puniceicoccales bacterium]